MVLYIYMIQCKKYRCEERYIGQTKIIVKFRMAEHRGYITNQVINRATGSHFNLPGHSLADLKFTILEQLKYQYEEYGREREIYFINKFNTFYQGLNREIKGGGEVLILFSLVLSDYLIKFSSTRFGGMTGFSFSF